MDFDHLDDAELDHLVSQARSGEGPHWLHELRAELALGPIDPEFQRRVVAEAAAEAHAQANQPTGAVRSLLAKKRTKVAVAVGAVVALQLSPLAAASELGQRLADPGSVISSIRGVFSPAKDSDQAAPEPDDPVEVVVTTSEPPSDERAPTTTVAREGKAEAGESDTADDAVIDPPDYAADPLPLNPVETTPELPSAPAPAPECDVEPGDASGDEGKASAAKSNDAAAPEPCADPADEDQADPPVDPDPDDPDDDVVLPPPPPPPTTTTSTTSTTVPGGSRSGS